MISSVRLAKCVYASMHQSASILACDMISYASRLLQLGNTTKWSKVTASALQLQDLILINRRRSELHDASASPCMRPTSWRSTGPACSPNL